MRLHTCQRLLATTNVVDNGQRTGPAANMTLGEFKRAKRKRKNKSTYVVNVLVHKTDGTYGPAALAVQATTYNYMKIFINDMRNNIPGIRKRRKYPVYASWTGNKMSTSMITKQLNSFFIKAIGGTTDERKRFSATLLRKLVTSTTHQKHPDLISNIAEHMDHDTKTAAKYYKVERKGEKAIETSEKIQLMLRGRLSSATKVVEEAEEEDEGEGEVGVEREDQIENSRNDRQIRVVGPLQIHSAQVVQKDSEDSRWFSEQVNNEKTAEIFKDEIESREVPLQ